MADLNQQFEDQDLQAPTKLIEALGKLQKESIFVPASVDEAMLKAVRPHLANIRKGRARWRRSMQVAALAACLLLAAWVAQTVLVSQPKHPQLGNYVRGDINHDGRVDIRDAFQLAREIKLGKSRGGDLNGDGQVDKADVDIIARQAVRLEKGGHS